MSKALLFLALLLPSSSLSASIFFTIPADYEKLNSPPPEIVVENPFPKINGVQVRGTRFKVDGSWYEEKCRFDERGGSTKTCGKPRVVQPGAHIFQAMLCSDPDCSITGTAWHYEKKINVGLRERITVDLSKEGAIKRSTIAKAKLSECAKAIEKSFYLNTCRAAGFAQLGQNLKKAHKICSRSWSKNTDLIFEMAIWQTAYLHPERCYTSEEIKRIPSFLTAWYVRDGFWPPGTLDSNQSSWSWARDSEDDDFWKLSGAKFREKTFKKIVLMRSRQAVVDELIDAALDPKKGIPPLIAKIKKNKSSFNPKLPNGHRMLGLTLLAKFDPKIAQMPGVSDLIAKNANRKSDNGSGKEQNSVHCALNPEARHIIDAITTNRKITKEGVKTIEGLLQRTPTDSKLFECIQVVLSDSDDVSLVDRMMLLAKYDCAKNRTSQVRGQSINQLMDPSRADAKEKNARLKVMKSFPDCIGHTNFVATRDRDESQIQGYDIEKRYYETGDLQAVLGSGQGKSLEIYYRVDGSIHRVSCGPVYKYTMQECQKNFTFDLSKLYAKK